METEKDAVAEDAENFLRENDPMYKKRNRKRLMDYPYLSNYQFLHRLKRETPLSNLGGKARKQSASQNLVEDFYRDFD